MEHKSLLIMGLAVLSLATAQANTITFTGASDTETIWIEDGITVDPGPGGSTHFHSDGSIAESYTSDGNPILISMGGSVFNLLSIDFLSFEDPMTIDITSDLGGSILGFNTVGTYDFTLDPGFAGVTSVTIALNANADGERLMTWDNVVTELSDVPEPGTFAIMGGGLVVLALLRRRRRA